VTVSSNSSTSTSRLALMKEGSGRTSQYMRKSSASIELPSPIRWWLRPLTRMLPSRSG
jgi:hypothetical protein